jgi:predicted DNA-binding transcriptional regulator AlpA
MSTAKTRQRPAVAGTTAPVAPPDPNSHMPQEWLRLGDCRQVFGFGRSFMYTLIKDGKVRSVSFRQPGRKTGVRLVAADSVRDFINRLADKQNRAA